MKLNVEILDLSVEFDQVLAVFRLFEDLLLEVDEFSFEVVVSDLQLVDLRLLLLDLSQVDLRLLLAGLIPEVPLLLIDALTEDILVLNEHLAELGLEVPVLSLLLLVPPVQLIPLVVELIEVEQKRVHEMDNLVLVTAPAVDRVYKILYFDLIQLFLLLVHQIRILLCHPGLSQTLLGIFS